MRKAYAAITSAGAVLLAGAVARAQSDVQGRAPHRGHHGQQSGQGKRSQDESQPLNLHTEGAGDAEAAAGRARMKAGDCNGALDAFDAALEVSTDPTIHRDRGLCHEKLGHPYPAIDDYRAYLTALPGAADADDISARLARLEDETSGRPPRANDDTTVPDVDLSPGGPRAAGGELEYVEPGDDDRRGSLRAGKGWSLAPLLSVRGWIGGDTPNGSAAVWAEVVGVQARYSTGAHGALLVEAGFEPFNLTDADSVKVSAFSAQIGYELRFPLDRAYDNQLLFAPGLGYEHLVVTPTDPQVGPFSLGAFVPRVRFGLRHMLASDTALDFAIDAGVANFFQYGSFPYDSSQSPTALVAADVSIAWGL